MRAWHLSKNNQKEARNENPTLIICFPLNIYSYQGLTKENQYRSRRPPVHGSRTKHILSFWVKQGFEKKRWTPHMNTFMLSLKTHDLLHAAALRKCTPYSNSTSSGPRQANSSDVARAHVV